MPVYTAICEEGLTLTAVTWNATTDSKGKMKSLNLVCSGSSEQIGQIRNGQIWHIKTATFEINGKLISHKEDEFFQREGRRQDADVTMKLAVIPDPPKNDPNLTRRFKRLDL